MCNCGGKNVAYEVRFPAGNTQTYATIAQAQAAISASGAKNGSTIKAVPK